MSGSNICFIALISLLGIARLSALVPVIPHLQKYCNTLEPPQRFLPKNCLDLRCNGESLSGVYTIYPSGSQSFSVEVYCDQVTSGGGWLVFQRRMDGSVNFTRNYRSYELGFGDLTGEHWLGNELLSYLTQQNNDNELRIDLENFNNEQKFAEYSSFSVAGTLQLYKLSVRHFTGDAGDSLISHDGASFSTYDKDQDTWNLNCAASYLGGWWYKACHHSNLNGAYLGGVHESYANGVNWYHWQGHKYSLKTTEMKFRPAPLSPAV